MFYPWFMKIDNIVFYLTTPTLNDKWYNTAYFMNRLSGFETSVQ